MTLQRFGIVLFILFLLAYGGFEAYDVWVGPRINIERPLNGSLVTESLVTVEGKTRNVSWITLLGRPITIDEEGKFSEKLLLPPGYSILIIEAKDRLGRETREELEVVRIAEKPASEKNLKESTSTSLYLNDAV